jgi:hypothetical protein
MNALEGGCLCGTVRFSVDNAFRYALSDDLPQYDELPPRDEP